MNSVVHFEVPADDRDRAKKFYSSVFGWDVEDMPYDDGVYTFAITTPVDENYMPEESGAINGAIASRDAFTPAPTLIIDVPSIDGHADAIEAAGGELLMEKEEVADMGYYSYFEDSEGNVIGLWETIES